jgi:type IV pilus assembly protein PilY1
MQHCEKHGYIVVFATGQYLNNADRSDTSTQTIYGVWDYGHDNDDSEFLGSFDRSTGELSNHAGENVTLLEQVQIDWRTVPGHNLRTLSSCSDDPVYCANWETIEDTFVDSLPNIGSNDAENPGHAGWYFDLPGYGLETDLIEGERVIKDLMIRDGKAIVISSVPSTSPCSGGGNSMVHEINACTGERIARAPFDIDDDGDIDEDDYITIPGLGDVPPSGISYPGVLHPPVVLRMPPVPGMPPRELKIFSTSSGNTVTLMENAEKRGIVYWREFSQ